MGEQPEALQLDPQHLRERDYEAEQAYTDRCPDLPLFTEGSDKQREARQAAKAAERESLLQGLRFLPETASSPQAELQKRSEAAGLFAAPRTVSYVRTAARGEAENRFPGFALAGFALLCFFLGLRQLHRAARHRQSAVKREEFAKDSPYNEQNDEFNQNKWRELM
ncbi:hypothetical protein [Stomatobaculum longum]|uniref:hypothetical protein n=1 Tax=Stomatobaculum longum TaxID=796942 RepID=UPI002805B4AD|nr:hypothetical protein [Stomatobaculum longum]